MKTWLLIICAAFFYMLAPESSYAIMAKPGPVEYTQPDGTKITLLLQGDEHIHWATTTDGYTVLSNSNGTYVYAIKDNQLRLNFSEFQAHDPGKRNSSENAFLKSVPPGLFFSPEQVSQMKQTMEVKSSAETDQTASTGFPTTGTRKLLMILANFNNTTVTYPQTNFINFMNQVNYNGTGSFRDYYIEVSYDS